MTTAPGLDAAPMKPHPFWMRAALQPGADRRGARHRLHQHFQDGHRAVLGSARPRHLAGLHRFGLAFRSRPRRARSAPGHPDGALGFVPHRDEFAAAPGCAKAFQRQRDRPCSFYIADAWYLHRRRPRSVLANLRVGPRHGSRHSRDRVDRKYRIDRAGRARRRSKHRARRLVALAAKTVTMTGKSRS